MQSCRCLQNLRYCLAGATVRCQCFPDLCSCCRCYSKKRTTLIAQRSLCEGLNRFSLSSAVPSKHDLGLFILRLMEPLSAREERKLQDEIARQQKQERLAGQQKLVKEGHLQKQQKVKQGRCQSTARQSSQIFWLRAAI